MLDWAECIRARLAAVRLDPSREAEIIEELSQHLDERYEELRAGGATDAEARRLAIQELNEPDALAQHLRPLRQSRVPPPLTAGASSGRLFGNLRQDLRFALRNLVRRPTFLIVAIATLTIGIGANATVFAFVDAFLLRPLPFGDRTDRIVTLHALHPSLAPDPYNGAMSFVDIETLRSRTAVFESVAGYTGRNLVITGGGVAERVRGGSITPGLFQLLGIQPVVGRDFLEKDGAAAGFEQVVILSHGLWTRRFGADPELLGRAIEINQRRLIVIGVMPPGFRFPERDDLWLPNRPTDENGRYSRNRLGVAALSTQVSMEQAQLEVDRISTTLQSDFPNTHRQWSMRVLPFRDAFVGAEAPILLATLLGAVAFVLAIGCANLANLLLARGFGRRREMAIRAAIGGSRAQLIRPMVVEGLIVSLAGAVLGLISALWVTRFIVEAFPEDLPYWANVHIDARVVLFTLAAGVAATAMFGLWPAFRASRPNLSMDLSEGTSRATVSRKQRTLQQCLVIAQIAMCLGLLVGANMMVRSYMQMMNADAGFDDSKLLSFRVAITGDRYDPPEAKTSFVRNLEDQLRNIPGVVSAAATTALPIDDGGGPQRIAIEGRGTTTDEEVGVSTIFITDRFFSTIGLDPVEGRPFTPAETQNPEADTAIVGRSFAREFWPNESAVGKRIGSRTSRGFLWRRIVGVAPDVQFEEFGEETLQSRRSIYYPYSRSGSRLMSFMVRAEGDPALLSNSVRSVLRNVDQTLPAFEIRTMAEVRANTTFEQRLLGEMMGVFGGIAVFLACLGLYGVLSYTIRQRTSEIGIRVTFGASSGDVLRMVLREGIKTAAIGIMLGIVLSVIIARVVAGVLYQVSPTDPAIFITTALLLLAVVLVAIYFPARRASKVDPMTALRM
jgi:putative ABC transport system permease protein